MCSVFRAMPKFYALRESNLGHMLKLVGGQVVHEHAVEHISVDFWSDDCCLSRLLNELAGATKT